MRRHQIIIITGTKTIACRAVLFKDGPFYWKKAAGVKWNGAAPDCIKNIILPEAMDIS